MNVWNHLGAEEITCVWRKAPPGHYLILADSVMERQILSLLFYFLPLSRHNPAFVPVHHVVYL